MMIERKRERDLLSLALRRDNIERYILVKTFIDRKKMKTKGCSAYLALA